MSRVKLGDKVKIGFTGTLENGEVFAKTKMMNRSNWR